LEVQSATESCPLCGTELSRVKFQEIQTKIKEDEKAQLAEQKKKLFEAEVTMRHRLEEEYKKELRTQKDAAIKLAKQEATEQLKQLASERDQAAKKLQEAEAREATAKKQAERKKKLQ
jgi:hypothetical protein